jgi:hypothetical protein
MPLQQALAAVEQFQAYPVSVISSGLVVKGIGRSIDSNISFWNGLIVESALAAKVGSMRIWGPFTH